MEKILWRSTDLCIGANVCFAGYSVDYKGALHCFPSGETVIRLLLLLWTGDHPAQCEICKSKGAGGKKGCRCRTSGMFLLPSNFFISI